MTEELQREPPQKRRVATRRNAFVVGETIEGTDIRKLDRWHAWYDALTHPPIALLLAASSTKSCG